MISRLNSRGPKLTRHEMDELYMRSHGILYEAVSLLFEIILYPFKKALRYILLPFSANRIGKEIARYILLGNAIQKFSNETDFVLKENIKVFRKAFLKASKSVEKKLAHKHFHRNIVLPIKSHIIDTICRKEEGLSVSPEDDDSIRENARELESQLNDQEIQQLLEQFDRTFLDLIRKSRK